jgi:hypothetical protein
MRVGRERIQLTKLNFKGVSWMICEFSREIIVGAFLCIYQDTWESEYANIDFINLYLEGRIFSLE